MLPCQHTFCFSCLQKQLKAQDLLLSNKIATNSKSSIICCLCQNKIELIYGAASLQKLPKNLHIESLLKLMEEESSPKTPKITDYRCAKCQTVSEQQHVCQHCMQVCVLEIQKSLITLFEQIFINLMQHSKSITHNFLNFNK